VITFDDVMCLICVLIYGALFYGMAGSTPKKRRKRGGVWTQDDSKG
jgi:hypothetical protein